MNKWGYREIVKFLKIYEHYPALWDPKNPDHVKAKSKESYFYDLCVELKSVGLVQDIKTEQRLLRTKIKNLKDVFRSEKIKVEKCKEINADYVPKLAWYDQARYMEDIISTTKPPAMDCLEEAIIRADIELEDDDLTRYKNETTQYTRMESPGRKQRRETWPPSSGSGIKRCRLSAPSLDNAVKNLNKLASAISSGNSRDQFGKYVATELNELPMYEASLAMYEIQTIIYNSKSRVYEEKGNGASNVVNSGGVTTMVSSEVNSMVSGMVSSGVSNVVSNEPIVQGIYFQEGVITNVEGDT